MITSVYNAQQNNHFGDRRDSYAARIADIEKNPGAVSLDQLLQVLHALDARLLLANTQRYADATPSPAAQAGEPPADW